MPTYQKFPFGKYAGQYLKDLPGSYLFYSLENFSLPEELQEDISNILVQRLPIRGAITSEKISAVYRDLSKKYHPDRGGSNLGMQALNDFREALEGK